MRSISKTYKFGLLLFAAVIAIACYLPGHAYSQVDDDFSDPVVVEANVDKNKATVGEPIFYRLTIVYDQEYHVELPAQGSNLGEFEIKDYTRKDPVKLEDDRMELVYEFEIAGYTAGIHKIHPLDVLYWKRDDEQDTIATREISIEIESLVGENAEDIQDIKDPFEVPYPYLKLGLIIGGIVVSILFLVLLSAFIIRKIRRKTDTDQNAIKVISEPPHIIALRELDELGLKKLFEKGLIKEYYIELSEIIRRYIEHRFNISTMERTTYEIIRDLNRADIIREQLNEISDFLYASDLVKFAKVRPDTETCKSDFVIARKIIETTMEIDS